jgi:chitodextrinase
MQKNLLIVLSVFAVIFTLLTVGISRCTIHYPVEQKGPVAKCSADRTSGTAPALIHFEGTGTSDSRIESYHWEFGDGTESDQQNPDHLFKKAGIYTVTFYVTESNGRMSSDDRIVEVEKGKQNPPAVIAYANITKGNAPLTVSFIGFALTEGTIDSYYWDFADGSTSAQPRDIHTFEMSGTYNVTLTVTDEDGKTGTASRLIQVEEPANNHNLSWFKSLLLGKINGQNPNETQIFPWLQTLLTEKLGKVQLLNSNFSELNLTNNNTSKNYEMLAVSAEKTKKLTETYMTELNNLSNLSGGLSGIVNDVKLCIYMFKLSCYYTYKGSMAMLQKKYVDASYYFAFALSYRTDTLTCLVRLTSLVECLG